MGSGNSKQERPKAPAWKRAMFPTSKTVSLSPEDWKDCGPVDIYQLTEFRDFDDSSLVIENCDGSATMALSVAIQRGNARNQLSADFAVMPVPLAVLRVSYATLCRAQIKWETDKKKDSVVYTSDGSWLSREEEQKLTPTQRKNAMCAALLYHGLRVNKGITKITGTEDVMVAKEPSRVIRFPTVAPSFIVIDGRPDDAHIKKNSASAAFRVKAKILVLRKNAHHTRNGEVRVRAEDLQGPSGKWFTGSFPDYPGQDFGVPPETLSWPPSKSSMSVRLSVLLHGGWEPERVHVREWKTVSEVKDLSRQEENAENEVAVASIEEVAGASVEEVDCEAEMTEDSLHNYVRPHDLPLGYDLSQVAGFPELASEGLASPFARAFEIVISILSSSGIAKKAKEDTDFYAQVGQALIQSETPSALDLVVALEIMTSMALGVGDASKPPPIACYAPVFVKNFGAEWIPQAIKVDQKSGASWLSWDRNGTVTIMCGQVPYKTYKHCSFMRRKLHLGAGVRAERREGNWRIKGAIVGGVPQTHIELGYGMTIQRRKPSTWKRTRISRLHALDLGL